MQGAGAPLRPQEGRLGVNRFHTHPFDFALFDDALILLSGELPYKKPAAEIFRDAIKRTGLLPVHSLYCSENLVETLAAQAVGMRAARLHPPEPDERAKLLESLKESNLLSSGQ